MSDDFSTNYIRTGVLKFVYSLLYVSIFYFSIFYIFLLIICLTCKIFLLKMIAMKLTNLREKNLPQLWDKSKHMLLALTAITCPSDQIRDGCK